MHGQPHVRFNRILHLLVLNKIFMSVLYPVALHSDRDLRVLLPLAPVFASDGHIRRGSGMDDQGSNTLRDKRFFSSPDISYWPWGPPRLLYVRYRGS